MDMALAEGAEEYMKGKGGLRAKILTDGLLRTGQHELRINESAWSAATSDAPARCSFWMVAS